MKADVLICSAGRRVELVREVRATLREMGLPGRVLACDVSELCAAGHVADAFFLMPGARLASFIPAVQGLCEREGVGLVIPTTDTTLAAYARAAPAFAAMGTTVAISSAETVSLAADKRATWQFFRTHDIRTVRQADVDTVLSDPRDWVWPLVVKPVQGSSSDGVVIAKDWLQFHAAVAAPDVIVQEKASGQEYTIDLCFDRRGRLLDAVPRERLEVRAGEVSKSRTVRAAPLMAIAEQTAASLPPCFGVLNLQVFWDGISPPVAIEINARFGGGFPLSHAAGAPFLRWLLEAAFDLPPSPASDPWQDGLTMLRYDGAVLVPRPVQALAR